MLWRIGQFGVVDVEPNLGPIGRADQIKRLRRERTRRRPAKDGLTTITKPGNLNHPGDGQGS